MTDFPEFKRKVLSWAMQFDTFCFLDNHHYQLSPHTQECLLAVGRKREFSRSAGTALAQLDSFLKEKQGWVFGHLGYDLKNEIESLDSQHADPLGFPDIYFFEPEMVLRVSENQVQLEGEQSSAVYQEIERTKISDTVFQGPVPKIQARMSRDQYLETVDQLQAHILRGDCYEVNYCQEFFAEQARIDPLHCYQQLSQLSPSPFSGFYRLRDKWLLCASPERFLHRAGETILSQPIKGTSRRFLQDAAKDLESRTALARSEKDRAENVMVVDLVRNDLSRICREGSVKVDELFGLYSFPQVHQMISTVSGQLRDNVSFSEIIRSTFPMGSMTGAPKKRVMELIEEFEKTRRGLFSGALGYISPDGDFDFNVVIRSIFYQASTHYLSFQAGSAITYYSEPEAEWEECLLKAAALKKVLEGE